jgi:hypothetical protein
MQLQLWHEHNDLLQLWDRLRSLFPFHAEGVALISCILEFCDKHANYEGRLAQAYHSKRLRTINLAPRGLRTVR